MTFSRCFNRPDDRLWPKADVPLGGHSCAGGKVHSPPKAGIPRSARLAPGKVRFYIGLLARPGRPNIESYQGDSVPHGALLINRVTGFRDPAIRCLAPMPRGTRRSSRVFKSVLSRAEKELALGSEKAGDFQHNGIRGDERAASLMRFLQSHLPITMAIAKGEAIDFRDKRSGQLDLIIYDKSASAPIFTGGENVLVPAEALYAVIEVKSVLSKDELEKSVEAAKTIRSLRPFREPFIGPRRDGIAAEDGKCRCA